MNSSILYTTWATIHISVMPELRETVASYFYLNQFLNYCSNNSITLSLLGIWADATDKEQEDAKGASEYNQVYRLDGSLPFQKGAQNRQTSVYPQFFIKSSDNLDPPILSSLVLILASNTNHAIILNFCVCMFQVSNHVCTNI